MQDWSRRLIRSVILLAAVSSLAGVGATASAGEDACVACHKDPAFLVKNRKLYDYYQLWQVSVHAEAGITCTDCHGGNPKGKTKDAAHAGSSRHATSAVSAINFKNIPKTCADCHDDIYTSYKKSAHFKKLTAVTPEGVPGPNCVTCHGSVNATTLNVNTVEEVCAACHNDVTGNHPEIPSRAKYILGRFLAIDRFYRYISLKGDPQQTKSFFSLVDPRREGLASEWHTFDLDHVENETRVLLDALKTERDVVLKDAEKKKPKKK